MISDGKKSSGAVENCATTVPDKGLQEGAGGNGPLTGLADSSGAPHLSRTETGERPAMDDFLAVFNQHINNAGERARAVMQKRSPKWLARVDAISLEGGGIMAIFRQWHNPATRRYIKLVTQFVNEDRSPLPSSHRGAE